MDPKLTKQQQFSIYPLYMPTLYIKFLVVNSFIEVDSKPCNKAAFSFYDKT